MTDAVNVAGSRAGTPAEVAEVSTESQEGYLTVNQVGTLGPPPQGSVRQQSSVAESRTTVRPPAPLPRTSPQPYEEIVSHTHTDPPQVPASHQQRMYRFYVQLNPMPISHLRGNVYQLMRELHLSITPESSRSNCTISRKQFIMPLGSSSTGMVSIRRELSDVQCTSMRSHLKVACVVSYQLCSLQLESSSLEM